MDELTYWNLVEPVWELIDIYEGPVVFLDTYGRASIPSRLLFAAHFCQSEVCNGGFWQFFRNSTGVLAPEAVEAFKAIGLSELATVIEQAMEIFGPEYIRDRGLRQKLLESLDDSMFNQLDSRFFELIATEAGGFEEAANRYASRYMG